MKFIISGNVWILELCSRATVFTPWQKCWLLSCPTSVPQSYLSPCSLHWILMHRTYSHLQGSSWKICCLYRTMCSFTSYPSSAKYSSIVRGTDCRLPRLQGETRWYHWFYFAHMFLLTLVVFVAILCTEFYVIALFLLLGGIRRNRQALQINAEATCSSLCCTSWRRTRFECTLCLYSICTVNSILMHFTDCSDKIGPSFLQQSLTTLYVLLILLKWHRHFSYTLWAEIPVPRELHFSSLT